MIETGRKVIRDLAEIERERKETDAQRERDRAFLRRESEKTTRGGMPETGRLRAR